MKTKLFKVFSADDKEITQAAEILKRGGLVAIPTETVYGLAANALDGNAVSKIFAAKGRPADNPLIVHISKFEDIYSLVKEVPPKAIELANAYWPGPLTIILSKSDIIPDEVSAGLPTVAIRMPSNPIAHAIIEKSGCPLAAPSANSSGLPSPTNAKHVMDDMDGKIEAIVDGGECEVGIESTVVTLATPVPRLLRPGGITHEQLEKVLGKVEIDPAVLSQLSEGERPASPGMKYKHYSPKADVFIVNGSLPSFRYIIDSERKDGDMALCFSGEENDLHVKCMTYGHRNASNEQAHRLFAKLREFDEIGAKRVFVRAPSQQGIGLGVYNRLLRSAAFKIIDPPLIFGLTGQTGSGKTTVAKMLREKGYLIIDGDIAARKVTEKGSSVLSELAQTFGSDILDANGELIRHELATRAFASEENRLMLNRITHPAITEYTIKQIKSSFSSEYKGVIVDAAAIFDSDIVRYCTKMIVVTAPEEIRLARIIARDSITKEAAIQRIKAQKSEQYYTERADVIIHNFEPYDLSDELGTL